MTNRNSCDHTDVSGIFPGAIVVGGQDWEDQQYSDHDAHGKVGKVVGVEDFVCNGWVQVQWNGNKDAQSYMYRLGFDGKASFQYYTVMLIHYVQIIYNHKKYYLIITKTTIIYYVTYR